MMSQGNHVYEMHICLEAVFLSKYVICQPMNDHEEADFNLTFSNICSEYNLTSKDALPGTLVMQQAP